MDKVWNLKKIDHEEIKRDKCLEPRSEKKQREKEKIAHGPSYIIC